MAKLTVALKKLTKLGVEVKKETIGGTDFFSFSINGKEYEFTNQPIVNDKAAGFCRTFENGSSPTFYTSINQLLHSANA